MKKILFTLIAVLSLATFADEPKFPGWKVKDAKVWEDFIAKSESNWGRATGRMMLAIAQNEPATFDELKAIIENVAKDLKFDDDAEKNARVIKHFINFKCSQVCLCTPVFVKEGFDYCKENYKHYLIHYYLSNPKELGFSAKERYDAFYDCALKFQTKAYKGTVDTVVSQMIMIGADLDDPATVKANLETLNRKLSIRLLEDKRFEQVIAKIRTALATY